MKKYRAVIHLTEMERASLALNNVANLLSDLGEDETEVEVVANSEGTRALSKAGPFVERIGELAGRGTRFVVCARSLAALGMRQEEFVDDVEVVPSGTGELVKRQTEGWAYVRP
ncbi:MAG: DsrE family protein [Methanothrix sp.]